jgi:hypothetical protein
MPGVITAIDVSIAAVLSEPAFEKGSDLVFESFGVIGPRNLQTLFMASRRLSDLSSDLHSPGYEQSLQVSGAYHSEALKNEGLARCPSFSKIVAWRYLPRANFGTRSLRHSAREPALEWLADVLKRVKERSRSTSAASLSLNSGPPSDLAGWRCRASN